MWRRIICKMLHKYRMCQGQEIPVLELKRSKTKWQIIGTYKPSLNDTTFAVEIRNILILLVLLKGDFNLVPNNPKLNELIEDHGLCNLLLEPTRFKSINPTCIDNFLTNKKTHENFHI